jgi:RNA polymerase sigma-70 factor, ECF subfamily
MSSEVAQISDPELITRAKSGDKKAFTTLVARHQSALFRYAKALTRQEADAEDVLQRAFLGAWRGLQTYEGRASVRSWLFTIARHEAHRMGRLLAGAPSTLSVNWAKPQAGATRNGPR